MIAHSIVPIAFPLLVLLKSNPLTQPSLRCSISTVVVRFKWYTVLMSQY